MTQRSKSLETFLKRLSPWFGERLSTDETALEGVRRDASIWPALELPGAVLWPQTTQEVIRVAQEAAHLGIALVPRGAGTGQAGGCIPGAQQVVVDMSQMCQLVSLHPNDLYAVVQPGLVTKTLDDAAQACGLMYPPDPASWTSCTLGGNIATNAGGPRAVKYGVTQRYVWGLEVVLMGGEVVRMGRRSIKSVAGFDVTSLFVGSEGTLGIITEATLHLLPAPRSVQGAWLAFATSQDASRMTERIFTQGWLPCMLELLDEEALKALAGQIAVSLPRTGACLLVELDGSCLETLEQDMTRLLDLGADAGALSACMIRSCQEREALQDARRKVSPCLKRLFPWKVSDDIAVPRSRMPHVLEEAQRLAAAAHIKVSAYGHLGDGNVHVNFLCATPEDRQATGPLRRQLWRFAVKMGGTVTGEHGIGLAKREALTFEHSASLMAWQRRLKALFDPQGLLNPGKVLGPEADSLGASRWGEHPDGEHPDAA